MSKDIKDYLHLYLGCEVLIEKSCYNFVHSYGIHKGDVKTLHPSLLFLIDTNNKDIIYKPILRPPSDIKQEEKTELNKIYNEWEDLSPAELEANRAVYMLKQQFDLFNLIPEGLAIDKTKLNNQK